MQFQNQFIPNTHGASGYSNVFIIQPVLPIQLNSEFFPFHILRPTLPVIAPSADSDGPAGVQGGLGDLNFFDLFVHPIEEWQTNIAVGYAGSIPTATHPQLGSHEWQLGPAAALVTTAIPKWNLGGIVEVPCSLQSDDYKVRVQPIAVRMLEDQWYVGWGDLLWTLDDQNGSYNLPINLRIGKVLKIHDRPMNIFLQGQYTPAGLHSGPTAEWGIKLNVTFLFPKAKLGPLFDGRCGDSCCE